VSVEVTGDADDQPRVLETDADGRFKVTDLPSGTYTVTLTCPDFQTFKREGIVLAPRMSMSMTVSMRPGSPLRD
jgi:hypothetical protein